MPSAGWASKAGTEVLSDREELLELTRALRAHVEWQAATGAFGLPVAEPGRREEPPPLTGRRPKKK